MEDLEKRVIEAIDYVRPSLQNDGGDIEYVKTEGNKVFVKLQGHCAGCPHAQATVKGGIESILREQFPDGVSAVEAIN